MTRSNSTDSVPSSTIAIWLSRGERPACSTLSTASSKSCRSGLKVGIRTDQNGLLRSGAESIDEITMGFSNSPDVTPVISVVLPTFNRCDHLPRAIESVLAQTFTDFELIVVDDGSTDGSQEYIGGL